jgi:transcription antitermination protein NusB
MLSRRSVRVKVIQLLYSASKDESLTKKEINKRYKDSIDVSFELFLFSLFTIVQVTRIADEDMEKRKAKFLPTDLDKIFDAKIFYNSKIQSIEKNSMFQKSFDKYNFREKSEKDVFRKIYYEFSKQELYQDYISNPNTTEEDDLNALLELFRYCRQSEVFNELIDDQYFTWEDDKSLVIGSIKKVLKGLPFESGDFFKEFFPEDEMVKEFGEILLNRTFEDSDMLMDIIDPLLQNWRKERLAILDQIMMKMAVVEFLHCETIPVKVTLNEYVEIAKLYSTSKSKDFINGVLDKVYKLLVENNKIEKTGRGLEGL